MAQAKETIDPSAFRELVPFDTLNPESLSQALAQMTVRSVAPGQVLFRRGDRDEQAVYLVSGRVKLEAADQEREVTGGTAQARHPLSNLKPRQFTARAVSESVVAITDSAILDRYLAWDQMAKGPEPAYEVTEMGGSADAEWMFQMLRSRIFLNLPTGNIQSLFGRFQEVSVKAGQTVIRQGEPGDYYYIIRTGKAQVTRKPAPDSGDVPLAEIGPGDAFGEDSLLSDEPRNASVTMLADGSLMRLSKEDFTSLLEEPLLKLVNDREAATLIREGGVAIDVRLESEFAHGTVKGAINAPLYLLRRRLSQLDPARKYVVFCDTGARSAVAAYIMIDRGLDVHLLEGGVGTMLKAAASARGGKT